MLEGELANQALAILFVAKEPVTFSQLKEVYPDTPVEELEDVLKRLAYKFNTIQGAVELRQIGGGYRLTTCVQHHEVIRAYLKTRPSAKLSLSALETLAVIAYKQPITLPEIMEIRGIKGTSTIHTLLEKKLIETRGRKGTIGRPIMYGTTKDFLVYFGLKDLSELPTLEEFEEILAPTE